jgi:hypothetical protein
MLLSISFEDILATAMALVTPKAAAKLELSHNKPASLIYKFYSCLGN